MRWNNRRQPKHQQQHLLSSLTAKLHFAFCCILETMKIDCIEIEWLSQKSMEKNIFNHNEIDPRETTKPCDCERTNSMIHNARAKKKINRLKHKLIVYEWKLWSSIVVNWRTMAKFVLALISFSRFSGVSCSGLPRHTHRTRERIHLALSIVRLNFVLLFAVNFRFVLLFFFTQNFNCILSFR